MLWTSIYAPKTPGLIVSACIAKLQFGLSNGLRLLQDCG